MWIDCKTIAKKIEEGVRNKVERLGTSPKLVSVVGVNDPSVLSYLKSQMKKARELGISYEVVEVDGRSVLRVIEELSRRQDVHGIFIARPLPEGIDEKEVAAVLSPEKDVEGIHPQNLGLLAYEEERFPPCTAEAVVKILESCCELSGKRVTVIGRSVTVGKPLSLMLLKKGRDATVTVCHSRTLDLVNVTRSSDVVVVAVGRAHFLKRDMVKENAIVIDVGINVVDGKVCGDVDPSVAEVAAVTPVPGGVGQVTTALLFEHVVKALEMSLHG